MTDEGDFRIPCGHQTVLNVSFHASPVFLCMPSGNSWNSQNILCSGSCLILLEFHFIYFCSNKPWMTSLALGTSALTPIPEAFSSSFYWVFTWWHSHFSWAISPAPFSNLVVFISSISNWLWMLYISLQKFSICSYTLLTFSENCQQLTIFIKISV